jgi:chromosome partitioning protein
MKTLVIANQKGGVGKTSTTVHLAYYFKEQGLKVAVIDLDTQGNASFTLGEYDSGALASGLFDAVSQFDLANAEGIAVFSADARLAVIEAEGFDVCLIDTPPSLGVRMAAALLSADFAASPIELEAYSLQGIEKMVTTIANIRRANPALKFLGMIPSKVDGRNPRHGQHLDELTRAYPQLVIPTPIGNRSSVADALASGVPVWSIKRTSARKAAQEMRAMARHIQEKMEI